MTGYTQKNKILFIKPPDRFLENEFVYQQLGPHYLQSYLDQYGITSDILVLYERQEIREKRDTGIINELTLDHLNMLLLGGDGQSLDGTFNPSVLGRYDIIGISVMSPQAPDAYLVNEFIKKHYPFITTVIGGSHPRYYQDVVENLPEHLAFDFIVPQDGWRPMHQIATGLLQKSENPQTIVDKQAKIDEFPPPTRPLALMERYEFNIAGVPAYHTITALGCPFSCNFCESGSEKVRKFSEEMIDKDLEVMAGVHNALNHTKKAVMFFDDVGLLNPKQVQRLSRLVSKHGYTTWRAFTHAYLVVRYKEQLLEPFMRTGGRRIGVGLETGSQRSLNLINKQNGKLQKVEDHYEAVKITNRLGIAVDAFTMIYPWEDEKDLEATTKMIEFIAHNPVNGLDEKGRLMKNHVDSTIMTPYQGTVFNDLIRLGEWPEVELINDFDPGSLYYKGNHGNSGWPYSKTKLPRERYIKEQTYRNSLRPEYR
jgi:radical SAM superfamily enzyme YgiQ (UPF0313 family)